MTTIIKRILAVIDRSASANDVFAQALALAKQNHSHLMLTHCLSLNTLEEMGTLMDAAFGLASPAKLQNIQDDYQTQVNATWQYLFDYALQAQAQGIVAEVACKTGEVGSQICQLAEQWEADLVVISNNGKPSWKEKLFGRPLNYVVLHAPCNVMVMPTKENAESLNHLSQSQEYLNRCYTESDDYLARSTKFLS
ncbi:MAG: universal stress protein [Nostoc sp. LLA-1]|nr:universal stress protein [Cyanocohniella sp. LLY]